MTMTPGITRAEDGMDGIRWNILGQAYVPKQLSEHSFSWHATFPWEPSCRRTSIRPRTSSSTCCRAASTWCSTARSAVAEPGDLIRLPQGIPHGIFNKTDADVKCLFWVSPSRRLYDLFWALHNLGPTPDPAAGGGHFRGP